MAKYIIGQGTGNTVTVNEVDLTDHVSSVDIDKSADDHDVTGFGAESHEHLLGLSEDTGTLNFWQDFEAGSVDATLDPLQGENEPFPVVVKAGGNTWTLQALLPNYKPLAGAVGEPSATECSFVCGDGNGWIKS